MSENTNEIASKNVNQGRKDVEMKSAKFVDLQKRIDLQDEKEKVQYELENGVTWMSEKKEREVILIFLQQDLKEVSFVFVSPKVVVVEL